MYKYQLVRRIDWDEDQTDHKPQKTPYDSNDEIYKDWPTDMPEIQSDSYSVYC